MSKHDLRKSIQAATDGHDRDAVIIALTEAMIRQVINAEPGHHITAKERACAHSLLAQWFEFQHEQDVSDAWRKNKLDQLLGQ